MIEESRPGALVVSVITPTFNEAANIPELLDRLDGALRGIPHEIIVVDDDSPDRTWEMAEKEGEHRPSVRVLRRFSERGLSSAVVSGMEVARGRTFAVMDADLQHDESALPEMVDLVHSGRADVCVGTRSASGGSYGEWSFGRRMVSWVATLLAKLLLRVPLTDPMSGYFVVSRDAFRRCAPDINPKGFKILLEFVGRHRELKVAEVGYTFRPRLHGETKLSPSVVRAYLLAIFEMRFGRLISPQFFLYALVGASGVIVNLIGFGIGELLDFPRIDTGLGPRFDPLYISVIFGIQLSIISNYLLNNYFTFFEERYRGVRLLWGFVIFELVSLFGIVIQVSVFQFLQNAEFLAVLGSTLSKYANNAIAILVALVSNYFLNTNYTWRRQG